VLPNDEGKIETVETPKKKISRNRVKQKEVLPNDEGKIETVETPKKKISRNRVKQKEVSMPN
jgi:hypothetical protein